MMLGRKYSYSGTSLSTSTSSGGPNPDDFASPILQKIKEKFFKGDIHTVLLSDLTAPLFLKDTLQHLDLSTISSNVSEFLMELTTLVTQMTADFKLLPKLQDKIELTTGSELAAWDAANISEAKVESLEVEQNKRQAEIASKQKNIDTWKQQIEELQNKISNTEECIVKLKDSDDGEMASELKRTIDLIDKSQALEKELSAAKLDKALCETHLQTHKVTFLELKSKLPF